MPVKISTANKICKKLSCQYGIINPPEVLPLKYSRTGKSVLLGYYSNQNNTIEINKYALELWDIKRISKIITHELMHTRCYQEFGHGGHGPRFRLLCKLCGVDKEIALATSKEES